MSNLLHNRKIRKMKVWIYTGHFFPVKIMEFSVFYSLLKIGKNLIFYRRKKIDDVTINVSATSLTKDEKMWEVLVPLISVDLCEDMGDVSSPDVRSPLLFFSFIKFV